MSPSPLESSPSLQSGGPCLANVFLDSLLSQRMTERLGVLGCWPAPSSPSLQSGGPCLTDYISGFPAFAENDGLTGG